MRFVSFERNQPENTKRKVYHKQNKQTIYKLITSHNIYYVKFGLLLGIARLLYGFIVCYGGLPAFVDKTWNNFGLEGLFYPVC